MAETAASKLGSFDKPIVYPAIPPIGSAADAGLDGLGASWNPGGEGITPWIDYMRFQTYRPEYEGRAILESFKEENKGSSAGKSKVRSGPTVCLYMPSNVAVSYAAGYSNTKFGVGGLAAAQMLGGNGSSEEVAKTLQNAAAGATPEAGFKAVADASNAISSFIGVEGSISGSDLAAVSQGRIFNPYEEQIFNGITFRAHTFQWKLIARNKKEAEDIDNILKIFKMVMLPSYDNDIGDISKKIQQSKDAAASPSGSVADKLTPDFSNIRNRYLNVPYRTRVQFIRVKNSAGRLGAFDTSTSIKGLFQIKDCVIDGLQVNYTPDGSYVNTNDQYVPAIDLSLSLKEISLVTSDDILQGF
jgi:hypothetical protein